ncbi:nitrate- and nitrite sensing domain-containing protein [Streptomyces sp. NBC_01476]|uniref:sensor histidine kinase n=1 Tax=Streptomyces sp. NBC_01476 TaxID=2903881 RepID=UPI002E3101B6|nr:nitrate- and nitrite sensing domain-containing protein [Streptomyces sp. NBC_01476]
MRFRGTTIRRKIVALLLIPLVSLTAIWAFAATITGRAVFGRPDIKTVAQNIGYPAEAVISSLQQERKVALMYVANPRDSEARIAFSKQEHATDASIAKLRTQIATSHARGELDSTAQDKLDIFLNTVEGATSLRQRVDNQRITRNDTYDAYNGLITPAFDLFDDLNPLSDTAKDSRRRAGVGLMRAREQVSREDALMTVAISSGHMNAAELTSFTFAVANERNYYQDELQALGPALRGPYDAYWQSTNGKEIRAAQDAVIAAGTENAPVVAAHLQWPTLAGDVFDDLGRLDNASSLEFTQEDPLSTSVITEAAIAGGFGLIAVIASVIVSVRIGRSLIRDLTGLRREAQEVSGTRLPRVMRRLAAGEQVDVETEVPRLQYTDDEMGQVGKALNILQRTAVEAAVRQADMRKGVSDVFVNLARRSQVLLHRQLTLLDAMERRTEDAEELADLFRLDHMTTRMRRHAEGLVILSGAAPSRQWRKPVQLMDVVRAAVAEVEDYERIEVRRLPRLAVSGAAVADLTHLLAELIENAAVFSPPHTQVRLNGEAVANGFVLEIDDRGLGLTPDALLEANLRLAETPEFELSDTDRLGLFVVSRLAQRHGVRVSLRQSPYGGTTAVVLIPAPLLTETGDDTGSTRIGDMPEPHLLRPSADTEHTFRQWGLDPSGGETHKEHSAHADEPALVPEDETEPAEPDEPLPLPRRRRSAGAPVLVSDHGRPVAGAAEPVAEPVAEPAVKAAAERAAGPASQPSAGAGSPAQPLPPAQPVEPVSPEASGRPARSAARAPDATTPEGGGTVLPRRIRQASLAPQLRTEATQQNAQPAHEARERSADEVRDRMASFQRGWQRGREMADAETDDTSTSVPRTTPEGNGR